MELKLQQNYAMSGANVEQTAAKKKIVLTQRTGPKWQKINNNKHILNSCRPKVAES